MRGEKSPGIRTRLRRYTVLLLALAGFGTTASWVYAGVLSVDVNSSVRSGVYVTMGAMEPADAGGVPARPTGVSVRLVHGY